MTPRALAKAVDIALESTVVLSFTRVGPAVRRRVDHWRDLDSINARGRRVLVTGVTSGLGSAAAHQLAEQGAEVILLGRDEQRTVAERDRIAAQTGNDTLTTAIADLADPDQVAAAAAGIAADDRPLHALVHNAGALTADHRLAPDGTELTVAVSVVGPLALTAALMPALTRARPGRVVWVSSGGMYTQRLDVDRLEMAADGYDGTVAYARAKRAQVVLSAELARRADPSRLVSHAMHPGWADTPGVEGALPGFRKVVGPLLRTPEEGADTMAWLATGDEPAMTTGGFWLDRRPRWTHRVPATRSDQDEAERLWAWACDRAGVDEGFPAQHGSG